MDFRARIKRHLHAHRHTGAGFLVGLTFTLFVCSFGGSDARVPVPKGVQVRTPVAATVVAVNGELREAAPELTPEPPASAELAPVSSAESSVQSSDLPQPPVSEPASAPSSVSVSSAVSSSAASFASSVTSSFASTSASSSSVSSAASSESSVKPVSSSVPSVAPASSSVSSSHASQVSSVQPEATEDAFPPFIRTVNIVSKVPNWGAMRTPAEWNRTFTEMTEADFVPLPAYQMAKLTVPMKELTNPITAETIPEITRKLVYSTRYFGAYDLDAGEFTAVHPGVDIKLARGTPVGAIAGGRVHAVSTTKALGLHVIIEHRIAGETYYSIYGHFDTAAVSPGQTVKPGQTIGRVGMTGNTSAPHVHLQIDRGSSGETNHIPYLPSAKPSAGEASRYVANPMVFIGAHADGQ